MAIVQYKRDAQQSQQKCGLYTQRLRGVREGIKKCDIKQVNALMPNLLLPGEKDGSKKVRKAPKLKQSYQVPQQGKGQCQRGREFSRPTMRIATKDSVVLIVGPQTKEIVIPKLKLDELKNSYLLTPRHQKLPPRRSVLQDNDKVYQHIREHGSTSDDEYGDTYTDTWSTRVTVTDRTQFDNKKLQHDLLLGIVSAQIAKICLAAVMPKCTLVHYE